MSRDYDIGNREFLYEREPILAEDFASILKQYNGLLSRVAAGYEANDALRQELLQEIAVAVWQGLQRFEHKSSLSLIHI